MNTRPSTTTNQTPMNRGSPAPAWIPRIFSLAIAAVTGFEKPPFAAIRPPVDLGPDRSTTSRPRATWRLRYSTDWRDAMKYLCLIYGNEQTMERNTSQQGDTMLEEYFHFTQDIQKSGHMLGGEALQPTSTA